MFIRRAWYVAAWASDVGSQPLARTLLGCPIVLFRIGAGTAVALADRCCHRGLPLSRGEVVEDTIVCGYHGLAYDMSGRCVKIPGQDHISPRMRVQQYPLHEQDELLWIWMGEPEHADRGLIPAFPWHNDHRGWPHRTCTQRIACNYRLVIDNLLDLTHLAFVHKRTIGGDANAHSSAEFEVTPTDRGVRLMRWMLNSVPPPTYVQAMGFSGRVDRWMDFEFFAPGVVHQFTGALDAGSGARESGRREGGFALRIMHAITPETGDSCFYFWSGCHGFRQSEPEVTGQLFATLASTFQEDAVVLEAQHASLRQIPEPLFSTTHDRARVCAEHMLDRLLAAEGAMERARQLDSP